MRLTTWAARSTSVPISPSNCFHSGCMAVRQASRVLEHIGRARDAGHAVILITHNLRHALSIADYVVVLARGRVAGSFYREEIEHDRLVELVARAS